MKSVLAAVMVSAACGGALGLAFAAPAAPAPAPASSAVTVKTPARFDFYRAQGVPAPYRGQTNPVKLSIANVIRGADLYNARCASCHGLMGFGEGDASGALRTRPADLAWSLSDPRIKDDYLLWTISEGGAPFATSMPAFKRPELRDEQIWQIITYMRAAFEGREARARRPREGVRQAAR